MTASPGEAAQDRGVEVLTFGCRLNIVESEAMAAAAQAAGEQNLLIVNSCAVTAEAEREAIGAIRKRKREQPDLRIVATGCATQINPSKFAQMPEIERLVPNAEKTDAHVWGDGRTARPILERKVAPARTHTRGFIDVQNGCDHRCTFCVIPFGRGASRSRTLADAVERAQRAVSAGVKEIVLTGVDLTSWGADLPGAPRLGRLARDMLRCVPHLPRLRLSSLDCAEVDEDLARAIGEEERLMPHLHLSLQAGSDLILKRMKRRHSRADAVRFCLDVQRRRPGLALGADLIVGFPTETEAMFRETLALVEDCGLSFLHVFPFSPRPDAPASRMPQVRPEEIKERAARLRAAGARALSRHLESRVGAGARVLIEHGGKGHDEDFSLVRVPADLQRGEIAELVIESSTGRELIGVPATNRKLEAASTYAAGAAP